MNAVCIRVLGGLAACGAWVTLAAAPGDSPSEQLLESYSYQPAKDANPPVSPDSEPAMKPFHYDLRDLDLVLADNKKHRSEALFTWDLPYNRQLELLAKPNLQVLNVPWSPMTAMEEIPFSPANATRKMEARVPVLRLTW